MNDICVKKIVMCIAVVSAVLSSTLATAWPASASPFGAGVFGADVGFGSSTYLSIGVSGNAAVNLGPNGSDQFYGSGTHTVSVVSTDVVGYKLYVRAPSGTSMTSGASTIAPSANTVPALLAENTWGYNVTASNNYVGMTATNALIKDATGPFKNGDDTPVTYGVLVGTTAPAGNYSAALEYTAVAEAL